MLVNRQETLINIDYKKSYPQGKRSLGIKNNALDYILKCLHQILTYQSLTTKNNLKDG